MLRLLFELFLIYLVYKIVFDFIIPIYRASKKMKEAVHRAQEQMQQHNKNNTVRNDVHQENKPQEAYDYIEFEEVK